jgi:hypothetical protein
MLVLLHACTGTRLRYCCIAGAPLVLPECLLPSSNASVALSPALHTQVKTRAVSLVVGGRLEHGGSQVLMLTPVADFVNHCFDPSCEFVLNEDASRYGQGGMGARPSPPPPPPLLPPQLPPPPPQLPRQPPRQPPP